MAAKTQPTDVDPAAYCAGLPTARRREEGARLLALFGEATGAEAVVWGPSIVGYGEDPSPTPGGDTWPRVGFSPRKASISLYGLQGAPGAEELLARLGKHRLGAGCVYVNGLADVDEEVLEALVALAWRHGEG